MVIDLELLRRHHEPVLLWSDLGFGIHASGILGAVPPDRKTAEVRIEGVKVCLGPLRLKTRLYKRQYPALHEFQIK